MVDGGTYTVCGVKVPRGYLDADVLSEKEQEFQELKKQADEGDSGAMYRVARCYEQGIGTAINKKKAQHYFLLGAKQGHPYAQFMHGIYLEQESGPKNKRKENAVEAFHWFHKAATQGHSYAQYRLSHYYRHGLGGAPKSEEFADKWLDLYNKWLNSLEDATRKEVHQKLCEKGGDLLLPFV
eukprot:GCRY01006781.1.p1 GENE.GCRY01006781.1~~GCRY01006781.1.p1  ORF type:complete len:182 (-),score=25.10 GCRY01006781.1:142-687(-)